MRDIVVIAHDIRSAHNIGSLLRTADGLGITYVYMTGYTPYPQTAQDSRLPHIAQKLSAQIDKTALGAAASQAWSHEPDLPALITRLQAEGYAVAALEQSATAVKLPEFKAPEKIGLLLGREVEGIDAELLELCDLTIEIPMFGAKESFNVVQAAAMALYHCRFA